MKERFMKLRERFRAWMDGDGYSDMKKARKLDCLILAGFLILSAACLFAVADYGDSPPAAVPASAPVENKPAVKPMTMKLLNESTVGLDTSPTLVLEFSEPVDEIGVHLLPTGFVDELIVSGNVVVVKLKGLEPEMPHIFSVDYCFGENGGRITGREFTISTKTAASQSTRTYAELSEQDRGLEVIYDDMPVAMDIKAGLANGALPLTVHTYAFPSVEKYAEQAQILADYDVDLSFLERLETTVALLHQGNNSISIKNPGHGAYILDAVYKDPVTGEDVHLKKPFFVSDLVVYLQTGGPETLAWVNSRTTGGPVTGYTVSFYHNDTIVTSAVTDERGVALLDYSGLHDSYQDFSSIDELRVNDPSGSPVYVDKTGVLGGESYYSSRDRYYSFFYIDRPLYRPTDTVNFWGFVEAYHGNKGPMPETVTVIFDPEGLNRKVEARIDAYGSYSGEIQLDQIRSSQYGINVMMEIPGREDAEVVSEGYAYDDDRYIHLNYEYVDVKEFQKPSFVISSNTDKTLYGPDEDVKTKISAQFYDGTPLPYYEMEFGIVDRYGEDRILQRITTDDKGNAEVTFPANQFIETELDECPARGYYFVRIASDGENIRHVGRYSYFPVGKLVKSAITRGTDGEISLRVDVRELGDITPEKRERFEQWWSEYYYYSYENRVFDLFSGEPASAAVETVINLRYVDIWGKYRWLDDKMHMIQTDNGVATLHIETPKDAAPGKYIYVYATSVIKEKSKEIISRTSYYEGREPYYGDGTGEEFVPGYSFALTDGAGGDLLSPYVSYVPYNEASVTDKQDMRFDLLLDGEAAENEGRILYTLIQNGVIEQGMLTGNSFTLRSNPRYAQSVNVVAAYFDGRDVHPIRDTLLVFDTNSVEMDITVTPDREGYRPGETANLQVHAADKDGNPVRGNLCVSVVDESVFALRDQYVNVVSQLYGDLYFYNSYIKKYTTSLGDIPFPGGMDGGKGDGDNAAFYDSFRSNFKDTAAFIPVRTDASGNASVGFTLPDNTTSWRITAVAVGDNLYGGNSKSNIISTLPFFIKPVMSSKYIAGDEVAMLAQGHGPLLDEESELFYSVRVHGDGFDKTITAEGVAYEAKELNFGQLPEGEYTVTATAVFSGYSDTVELPIAVINSNLELVVSREIDLKKPLDINAVRYPVVMSFFDEANSPYYSSISSLLGHYCMIANQRMSRFVAKRSLMSFMDPEDIPQYIRVGNESASDMQNPDGGIGWNVGGESEPELTTKVLLVAQDQFDLNSMRRYYREILQTTKHFGVRASCYLGLAAIGDPVADEIYTQLNRNGNLSTAHKAYYIAALAYCGDTEGAMREYQRHIAPLVSRDGDMCHVKRGTAANAPLDENATAAVWIAASKLGLADADGISLFSAQFPWRIGSLFECMIYVTNYNREVTPMSFQYTANGVSHTVDMGLKGQRSISFDKSEFESLELHNVPDSVRATAYYIGEPGEAGIQPSDKMSISKNIRPLGSGKYEIALTIEFDGAPRAGQYDISDWIPSNMRLYSVQRENDYYFNYSTEGQKIYFTYYDWGELNGKTDKVIRIVYTARKTFNSKAVAGSAYMIHGDSGENCSSEQFMIE